MRVEEGQNPCIARPNMCVSEGCYCCTVTHSNSFSVYNLVGKIGMYICHWIVLPVETGLLYHTFKINKNGPECSQGSGW